MTAEEAFEMLYVGSRDRLVAQIAALSGDVAEAQDHVQEAFVAAWARWDRVGGLEDPAGWVRRCAWNRAVSRWRRGRRVVLRSEVRPASPGVDTDRLGVIDALQRLPVRERECLVLHVMADLSVAEVAAELSVPEGSVKSWLSRGRTRLAVDLGPNSHDEEAVTT